MRDLRPIEEVMAGALLVSPSAISESLSFDSIPEWDSLAHVDLMIALEGAYGVTIDEDQMIQLTSVKAIRAFLAEESPRG